MLRLTYLCDMIQIGSTLVSEDLLEKEFVCNLSACKGACCVEGDSGAPLLESETGILEEINEIVMPYLRDEGKQAITEQGPWVIDDDGDLVTPLVNGKECAYVIFDEKGTTLCGIEKAWNEGDVKFRKPVSCHLYPIRITEYNSFHAVNYDKWDICSDACALGEELNVPVYKFAREGLVRRYGEKWFEELDEVATAWLNR